MERINKPLFWTERSLKDLNKIHSFNAKQLGFAKALEITHGIIERIGTLEDTSFDYLQTAAKDEAFLHLRNTYRKFIEGHYKITFREGKTKVYINRIFDTRQNPNKNK